MNKTNLPKFTPEAISKLKYYVYRLVDPRDGLTFYVGKGKGNRVFAHARWVLENYDGENYLEQEEDKSSLKYNTIKDIQDTGLQVIHIIHRYGMDEAQAFEVEQALIDVYSLENLSNKISGHDADRGAQNALILNNILSAPEFIDKPENPKYMIIKVNNSWVERRGGRYEATRSAWHVRPNKAKEYPYVLSVTNGIVKDVYEVKEWKLCESRNGRAEFDGVVAPDNIRKIFLNKRIPSKYIKKGSANPVQYCKI